MTFWGASFGVTVPGKSLSFLVIFLLVDTANCITHHVFLFPQSVRMPDSHMCAVVVRTFLNRNLSQTGLHQTGDLWALATEKALGSPAGPSGSRQSGEFCVSRAESSSSKPSGKRNSLPASRTDHSCRGACGVSSHHLSPL